MPRCLIIQHVSVEGPYAILPPLQRRGVEIDVRDLSAGASLPDDLSGYDGLVVMGGPMSAASDDGFPTREHELHLLRQALTLATPTLGVCLGAQLLAAAAGASVFVGAEGPEIGWGPVDLIESAIDDDDVLAGCRSPMVVLHWHGDTFELPTGAVHLAHNYRYRSQAARIGPVAWALQFHIEVDDSAVALWAGAFAGEAEAAGVSLTQLLTETGPALAELTPERDRVLDRFADLVARPTASVSGPLTTTTEVVSEAT